MKLHTYHLRRATCGLLSILFTLFAATSAPVYAGNFDLTVDAGDVRVHYPESVSGSCDALLLGVGTAMSVSSYDRLSEELNAHGYLVVILDHAPGELVKTDSDKYRNLAQAVKGGLVNWLSGRGSCTGVAHWIMGGHSAGGQAAQNAIAATPGLADAVFSIDPYDATAVSHVSLPALYWGFNLTSCFVEKEKAAAEAYLRSDGQRAFYRVQKEHSWGPCGYSPKYFHCSFCDNHCPGCTNCMYTPDHFFVDVAASVDKFITAAFSGGWSKSALAISGETPVDLFVDSETP